VTVSVPSLLDRVTDLGPIAALSGLHTGSRGLGFALAVTLEFTHVVAAQGPFADNLPDFLVNDTPDANHTPDTIHFWLLHRNRLFAQCEEA
jgi:hypothetical protein